MLAAGRGVVAGPAHASVEAEARRLPRDIRLGHVLERGVNLERLSLDPRLGREFRQPLERGDELGPAIGIARIIERIDADEQVARPRSLRPAQGETEEDRVACGHVSDGNIVADAALGHIDIRGQRRPAECRQVERQDDMPLRPQRAGYAACGGQLDLMPLVIVDRQREEIEPGFARVAGGDHRIEPPGHEDNGKRRGGHGAFSRAVNGVRGSSRLRAPPLWDRSPPVSSPPRSRSSRACRASADRRSATARSSRSRTSRSRAPSHCP